MAKRVVVTPDPDIDVSDLSSKKDLTAVLEGAKDDIDLLSKVHTRGLLLRHRNADTMLKRVDREQNAKLAKLAADLEKVRDESIKRNVVLGQQRRTATREDALVLDAMMGRVALRMTPPVIAVNCALLNSAAEGEFTTRVAGQLVQPITSEVHRWMVGEHVRATLVASVPGGVPAPTITNPVEISDGTSLSVLTWGTGAGTYVAGVAATGTITCIAGADLADGETVTIKDCHQVETVFEFDDDGTVTAGRVRVPFLAGDTAIDVAHSLAMAIRDQRLQLTVDVADEMITLVQKFVGDIGNHVITDTVADLGFVVSGFADGAAAKITVTFAVESTDGAADDKLPFGNFTIAPVTQTYVVF